MAWQGIEAPKQTIEFPAAPSFSSIKWIKLMLKTIGNRKKRLCVRLCSKDKHHLRKSADRKAQISPYEVKCMVRDGHNSASVVRSAPWLHFLIWKKRLPTWSSLHWGYIVPPAGVSSTYLAYNGHPKPTRLDLCPFRKYSITSYAGERNERLPDLCLSICRSCLSSECNLTHNLFFLFPIVFSIIFYCLHKEDPKHQK